MFIPNHKTLHLKWERSEILMQITLESVLGGRGEGKKDDLEMLMED